MLNSFPFHTRHLAKWYQGEKRSAEGNTKKELEEIQKIYNQFAISKIRS